MTLTAFAFTFLIGSVFGAALMLAAVVRAESWRLQQSNQAAEKLARVRSYWNKHWLIEARRADKAETALDAIRAQHVAAGIKGGAATKAKLIDRQTSERAQVRAVAQAIPFQPLRPRDEVVADIRQRREALKVTA